MDLRAYLRVYASQQWLAEQLGVTQGTVSRWCQGKVPVPAKHVLPIERITGRVVSRFELRPDLYPIDDPGPRRPAGEAA